MYIPYLTTFEILLATDGFIKQSDCLSAWSMRNSHLAVLHCLFPIVWFQKISIPPHGRDFSYDPPTPLDFPKTAHKLYPSPPPEIPIFSYTPWKYFYFLFKAKN